MGRVKMGNNKIYIRIGDFKLEGSRGVGRPKHVGGCDGVVVDLGIRKR